MDVPAIDGLIVLPTRHCPSCILEKTVAIAQARGIMVFAQIDFSRDATRVNLALKPACLVIVGNPAAGTPVMMATPTAAIDLPMKILAFEDAAERRWVAYNDPEYLRRRHGFPEELIRNLAPIAALAAAVANAD